MPHDTADTGCIVMRQPRIRHNDYSALEVPPLGDWPPVLGVSIVIPAYRQQDKLDLVLAGPAPQSHPDHQMEVIVDHTPGRTYR
jgi:hypothetical protein